MIKHLIKYRSLVAAIFVLIPLLFWFAYSEIGQYTVEKQHPPSQDYCLIVRVIKTEISKTTALNLFNLNIEKSAQINHIDETTLHIVSLNETDSEHFFPSKENTQIYLYNRTFLI